MATRPDVDPGLFLDVVCRDHFEPFFERVFHTLNPGTPYERTWHVSAIAHRVEQIARGEIQRLLVTLPPRHMKSQMISVAFTAWILGREPASRTLSTSYGQDLSDKLHADFRKVMQADWYRRVFPNTASSVTRTTNSTLETRQEGVRRAAAMGGAITGFGYHNIIVDDPMKASEASSPVERQNVKDFWDETLVSRLEDKRTGRIIVIMQRLHEDDLAGYLLDKGGFTHLNLPAIAMADEIIPLQRGRTKVRRIGELLSPVREPLEVLERLRTEMGGRLFEAQWQQNRTSAEGAYFRFDRCQFYGEAPPRDRLLKVVQSWDTASTDTPSSDWSVCTTWGYDGRCWLLLDLVRAKLEYTELLARARLERNRWRADTVLIEKTGVGFSLCRDLHLDTCCEGLSIHHAAWSQRVAVKVAMPKQDRFLSQVERLYSGFAKLPREAPWLTQFRHECTAFPDGRHDDQVDSVSQFLNWASTGRGRSLTTYSEDGRPDYPRPR